VISSSFNISATAMGWRLAIAVPSSEAKRLSSCFDLKTRSIKRMDVDTLGDELARLWIGQIPNFVLALTPLGDFQLIQHISYSDGMATRDCCSFQ
jgi:hypothetical protein